MYVCCAARVSLVGAALLGDIGINSMCCAKLHLPPTVAFAQL